MEELTKRQRQILEYIKTCIRERGYPPSVREIGEAVGLKSTSTVHAYLSRLEQKGFIRRDPTKPRAIEVIDEAIARSRTVAVPLVGQVTAGQPILAVENIEDVLPLPAGLVPDSEVFALRIRGNSMIGAGILDGDYAIVRRQDTAENGDIVVALIDDEATVKRFFREHDRIRLQPENPAMEPIYVREARILGKVVALLRRLS
ncbi:MAG: repressor LexA [Bacillota bacterium]|nr:MAG: repressor LexA [Bacillota bacterium]